LCSLVPDELATCCYVELQPNEGTATVVLAGHPPPVINREGEAWFVDGEPGPPLGVDAGVKFTETTVMLPRDSLLVLYTDGLVDQVEVTLQDGLERLRAVVAAGNHDLEAVADSIIVETASSTTHDDAALLLVALRDIPRSDPFDVGRWLPADAGSASASRQFIADVLTRWSIAPDVVDIAELLVSELVTNAVLHTSGGVTLRVNLANGVLRVAVTDESGERPAVLTEADLDTTGGRGLKLVDEHSDRWGGEPDGIGKTVWFELMAALG
jgi:anti-sigma regulatory factor (Ser/Thr protein kinase)